MSTVTHPVQDQLKAQVAVSHQLLRINRLIVALKTHIDEIEKDVNSHTLDLCVDLQQIERRLIYILAKNHRMFGTDAHVAISKILESLNIDGEAYPSIWGDHDGH